MDFYRIKQRRTKDGGIEVYPDFLVKRSKDLMVRAKSFYAIWDDTKGLWSTDEYDVQRMVDAKLREYSEELLQRMDNSVKVAYMGDFSSYSWKQFRSYMQHLSDNAIQLDENLTFANSKITREDYASKRLPYDLKEGPIEAYEELIDTLYNPKERDKLEWAMGSVIAGDSKWIQKFIVLHGGPGSGKSTWINILEKIVAGYYTTFEAKSLTGNNNSFAMEMFKSNPRVAIEHDGDLSRIEDNTKLNSIVSHEPMTINEKNKPQYTIKIGSFLFMGTNKPVKITDAKSGIIRRLIDVNPSGRRLTPLRYQQLVQQINFELGAIAYHCLDKYRSMGAEYYDDYTPIEMMLQTNVFYDFIEENFEVFQKQNGTTLSQAYDMYKVYCEESALQHKMARYKFREELKNYFNEFHERIWVDGKNQRSWYDGFKIEKFLSRVGPDEEDQQSLSLVIDRIDSLLDKHLADAPAQYANLNETPSYKWDDVESILSDLDTSRVHYVQPPLNHIVIDFDLKDDKGNKDMGLNLVAASKWPPTYAEFSKSGAGIHLHYIYEGDPNTLSRIYDENIEIKVFTGQASLRRKLSFCNNVPVAKISGGLPVKEKKMESKEAVQTEKHLRAVLAKALRKEVHAGTKPSVDFIHHVLQEAYKNGVEYDVTDMKQDIYTFASSSTNQALYCIRLVQDMKFKSQEEELNAVAEVSDDEKGDETLVLLDVEVFPNLFVVSWKFRGADTCTTLINPTALQVEEVLGLPFIGWNNRRYDNHILFAAKMGYTIEALYKLSKRIIEGDRGSFFGQAYNISHGDAYDFASTPNKMSLKKWQVKLGIHHLELGIPWDKPVPEHLWPKVAEYCENDVNSLDDVLTEIWPDYVARKILAELSGLKVNATTRNHAEAIVFEGVEQPQTQFIYTNLATGERVDSAGPVSKSKVSFPGYEYNMGVSTYRGVEVGEGGYVYEKIGLYNMVGVLDIQSQHPTSIVEMQVFGPRYTKNFEELLEARLAIKHEDFDTARKTFQGRLAPYLEDTSRAKDLSNALKIVINSIYGFTAAKFPNAFRDPRNKDNIVAKRGALFMIDLLNHLWDNGIEPIHIKTDSIKIPEITPEIIEMVKAFAEPYGYSFEHEVTYEKMALVNKAVLVAKAVPWDHDLASPEQKAKKSGGWWEAVGKEYQRPYVFKTLFSGEDIVFDDLIEVKNVATALYLDFSIEEPMYQQEVGEEPQFIGKVGAFVPVQPGTGGGLLLRVDKNDPEKFHAAEGSKGHLWKEAEVVRSLGIEDTVDIPYYDNLVYEARKKISEFGDTEQFLD